VKRRAIICALPGSRCERRAAGAIILLQNRIEVTTDSGAGSEAQDSKPAIRVTADSGGSRAANDSKPAIGVTTGFLKGEAASGPAAKPSVSACEPYRELIGLEIEQGRNSSLLL
jgi:hypothetical protein